MSRLLVALGVAAVVGITGVTAGCQQEETEEGPSTSALSEPFNRNNVLTNIELLDPEAYSEEQIQRFLEATPFKKASVLATYEEGGKRASAILIEAAMEYGVNPLELIVRLQMEQSLISKTTADKKTLDLAFGCGCPHAPVCATRPAQYTGFTLQAQCSARTLRASMDTLLNQTPTVSGWKKGLAKRTEDMIEVKPENEATAALYSYTPWVGETGGGKVGVGGQSLHRTIWVRFDKALRGEYDVEPPPDGGAAQGEGGSTTDGGAGASECTSDTACASKGFVCDTTNKRCVECTTSNTSRCSAAKNGAICLSNNMCGCNADVNCGTSTSGRVCDATSKRCLAGCRATGTTGGNGCPSGQTCTIPSGVQFGVCSGATTSDAGATKDGGATTPEPSPGEEEDPGGHVTPSTSVPPPPPVGTPGSRTFTATGEQVNIGNGADRKRTVSACNATPGPVGDLRGSAGSVLLLGIAFAAIARRRR